MSRTFYLRRKKKRHNRFGHGANICKFRSCVQPNSLFSRQYSAHTSTIGTLMWYSSLLAVFQLKTTELSTQKFKILNLVTCLIITSYKFSVSSKSSIFGVFQFGLIFVLFTGKRKFSGDAYKFAVKSYILGQILHGIEGQAGATISMRLIPDTVETAASVVASANPIGCGSCSNTWATRFSLSATKHAPGSLIPCSTAKPRDSTATAFRASCRQQ